MKHPTPWTYRRPKLPATILDAALRSDEHARELADPAGRQHWEVVDERGSVVGRVFMTEAAVAALVDEASTLAQLADLPSYCMTAQVKHVRGSNALTPAGQGDAVQSYHAHMLRGRREWFRDDLPCRVCLERAAMRERANPATSG